MGTSEFIQPIQVVQVPNTLQIGGLTLPAENLVILCQAQTIQNGATHATAFNLQGPGGLNSYQVPTGKRLRLVASRYPSSTAWGDLFYCDNDLGTDGTGLVASALNAVYSGITAGTAEPTGASLNIISYLNDWIIPAGKFLNAINGSGNQGNVEVYGYLEDV